MGCCAAIVIAVRDTENIMEQPSLQKLLDFLVRLTTNKIHYQLECNRSEAIMVLVSVPGERWEVEYFTDGHIEVEVFRSALEGMKGEEALVELFVDYAD